MNKIHSKSSEIRIGNLKIPTFTELEKRVKELEESIVTSRKLEDASKKKMKIYQDFYDNGPDMFGTVEILTGRIVECNNTLAKAIHYSKSDIIGLHISKLYHPDSEKKRQIVFKQFLKIGEIRNAELQLKRKDGSKIEVNLNASAVYDEKKKILYSRSVLRDITRQKKAEDKLKEITAIYDHAVKTAKLGIWRWDIQTDEEYFSDEWCRIIGYEPDDPNLAHTYYSWESRIHPDDLDLRQRLPGLLIVANDIPQMGRAYVYR